MRAALAALTALMLLCLQPCLGQRAGALSGTQTHQTQSGRSLYAAANNMAAGGDLEEAVALYKQALEQGYDSAMLRNEFGITLVRLKRFAEAAEQLELARKMDPKNFYGSVALYESLLETGQYKQALSGFRELRRQDKTEDLNFYFIARCYEGLGECRRALGVYLRFLKMASWEPTAPIVVDARERAKAIRQTEVGVAYRARLDTTD